MLNLFQNPSSCKRSLSVVEGNTHSCHSGESRNLFFFGFGVQGTGFGEEIISFSCHSGLDPESIFKQRRSLSGAEGSTLFKFRMNTCRTDKPLILTCDLNLSDKPYILIDKIPGDIKIQPVCVNQLRLVQMSTIPYSMSEPKPNPAGSTATFDYSIAFDGKTTFDLYDSFGNRLAAVFNETLIAGSYRLNLNIDALHLSSGTYYLRMQSGAYGETRAVVVVR